MYQQREAEEAGSATRMDEWASMTPTLNFRLAMESNPKQTSSRSLSGLLATAASDGGGQASPR